jgi:hypothetical protein
MPLSLQSRMVRHAADVSSSPIPDMDINLGRHRHEGG